MTTPPPPADRDHTRDVLRLRRRVLSLEDLADRHYRLRGVRIPQTLTTELAKTGRWAREICIAYGFDLPDVVAAGRDAADGTP